MKSERESSAQTANFARGGSLVHLSVKGDHIRNKPNRNYFIICRYIVKFLSSGCAGPRNEHSKRRMIALLSNPTCFCIFLRPALPVRRYEERGIKKTGIKNSALN